jgi:putative FmdB family regulatory protein
VQGEIYCNPFPLEARVPSGYFPAMPIYEFHCAKCEQDSEILVRSSHWQGTKCPHCGSPKLAKKFSVFASATATGGNEAPSCTGKPSSCGMCGTGRPHSH